MAAVAHSPAPLTINAAVDIFFADMRLAPRTKKTYRQGVRKFVDHLAGGKDADVIDWRPRGAYGTGSSFIGRTCSTSTGPVTTKKDGTTDLKMLGFFQSVGFAPSQRLALTLLTYLVRTIFSMHWMLPPAVRNGRSSSPAAAARAIRSRSRGTEPSM